MSRFELLVGATLLSGCGVIFIPVPERVGSGGGGGSSGGSPGTAGGAAGGFQNTAGGAPSFFPDAGGQCVPATPVPFGTSTMDATPPPISGGTLAALADGHTVAAADPDRDQVWLVDILNGATRPVTLSPGDEPGRVIQDGAGRVHVALRGGGAVVTIDPSTAAITARRSVCAEPRGLAWLQQSDTLHVACATGELVTLPAAGGNVTSITRPASDLRDVIAVGSKLYVTRFRSAEVIELGETPNVRTAAEPLFTGGMIAAVAWRTVVTPDGGLLMSHQHSVTTPVDIRCGAGLSSGPGSGYGGPDGGSSVVTTGLSYFNPTGVAPVHLLLDTTLPVDLAVSSDCRRVAVVSAGTGQVLDMIGATKCAYEVPSLIRMLPAPGAIAAVVTASGALVIQQRDPAQLSVAPPGTSTTLQTWPLPGARPIGNSGHKLFHTDSSRGIACASCHPEGREDGLTWNFDNGFGLQKRRTQSLRGGLLATAPFHWDGDMNAVAPLMMEVFARRMGGVAPTAPEIAVMAQWLDALPAVAAAPGDSLAIARGKTLFESTGVGCTNCHNGPHFTDNTTRSVNTGGMFQVPSLVGVGARAPYMHNGCAPTLRDRFNPACGGGDSHGRTSQLSAPELDDLVVYLSSL